MVVFGKKWFESGKVVFFGQNCLFSGKVALIGQKWLYSGNVSLFGQIGGFWYYSKICCIRSKMVV